MTPGEFVEIRHEPVRREAVRDGDANEPLSFAIGARCGMERALRRKRHGLHLRAQPLARTRERIAAWFPNEKLGAEALLERRDMAPHGRMAELETPARSRKALCIDHREENAIGVPIGIVVHG